MPFVSSFLLFKQCCYKHTCPRVFPFTWVLCPPKMYFPKWYEVQIQCVFFFFLYRFSIVSPLITGKSVLSLQTYDTLSLLISNFPLVRPLPLRVAGSLGCPREEGERSRWRKGLSGGGADPQPQWAKPLPLHLFSVPNWERRHKQTTGSDWEMSLKALGCEFHSAFLH